LGALLGVTASLFLFEPHPPAPSAQELVPKPAHKILYIVPNWLSYLSVSDAGFAEEVRQLRTRIGEGRYVRVGFTVYIPISIDAWRVDVTDTAAIARELATTIARMDRGIARARAENLPICLSFLTALRSAYDPAQRESEREDRRNMQWYGDNGLARGWWTHSRYARKQRAVQEAYIRHLGRELARRMAQDPAIVVAASGDGEVELSFDRSPFNPSYAGALQLADYSPFAVAEFRDWLRHGGLYGDSQPLAGQGYEQGARYKGDAAPDQDTNRDGHTLNGNFGTSFTSWNLRYFDWSLSDNPDVDPNAIPATAYEAPGWDPRPDAGPTRFDAPRVRQRGQPFWNVWDLFRQTMIWRHNVDFARWMTTSPDHESGLAVPAERWYSDQIPADRLYGASPENPNLRFETSASAWWSADVSPYGALGITSFNANLRSGAFARTLIAVAPRIAARNVRWGILEWHPSIPISNSLQIYLDDMAIIEQYRPALIVPIFWGHPYYQIQNTGFETALRELVNRIKDGPSPAPAWWPTVRSTEPVAVAPVGLPRLVGGRTPAEWLRGPQRPPPRPPR
jgi:hypothetical protein